MLKHRITAILRIFFFKLKNKGRSCVQVRKARCFFLRYGIENVGVTYMQDIKWLTVKFFIPRYDTESFKWLGIERTKSVLCEIME